MVKLVQVQDEGLANIIDTKIIPFAPSSVVPEFFLAASTVERFNFLELLHELQVDGRDIVGDPKLAIE